MNISIFAKKPTRAKADGHLQRVSSIIRGQQIAAQIGAKLNPTEGYENDVCIYVKPHVKPDHDFNFEGKPYLDVIDGWKLLPLGKRHPKLTLIACSYVDFEYISSTVDNKVVHIPQHHCNFERTRRSRSKITTVGCIGSNAAFSYLPSRLKQSLQARNIELLEFSSFETREDIVNFYQSIDVQIVWRPYLWKQKIRLSNPLKLINAASFGVPTIALDEPAFVEIKGSYLPVRNHNEFLERLDALIKSPNLYHEYAEKCRAMSETYHIESIGKRYTDLIG